MITGAGAITGAITGCWIVAGAGACANNTDELVFFNCAFVCASKLVSSTGDTDLTTTVLFGMDFVTVAEGVTSGSEAGVVGGNTVGIDAGNTVGIDAGNRTAVAGGVGIRGGNGGGGTKNDGTFCVGDTRGSDGGID